MSVDRVTKHGRFVKDPLCFFGTVQDQKPEDFLHIMKSASLYGMPQLLACCEYYLALSTLTASHADVRAQCAAEPLLVRSWHRIAEAFCEAWKSSAGSEAPKKSSSQPCSCSWCRYCRGEQYGGHELHCKCTQAFPTVSARESFLPSPKEFMEMAKAGRP